MVSAAQPKATVHPLVIGPSTPQFYPVTAAPGNTYTFGPGQYNYYGTSIGKTVPGVATAVANPNNGNLNAYESTKAYYAHEYAAAVNGVNLLINAPTVGATATTVTITVYEKAAFQTQVANPLNAWGDMGMYATYNLFGGYTSSFGPVFTTSLGKETTIQAITTTYTINPIGPFFYGWFTGTQYQVTGYVDAQSLGTTGTVNAQGLVQEIAVQFS